MRTRQCARLVRVNAHKVGQARNMEDLDVVLTESTGEQLLMDFACAGQQPHNQRNPGAVDVVHVAEIEQDDVGSLALGFCIR